MKVHVVNTNHTGNIEGVDQFGTNMRNVCASLIHETLISKMSKYGIGHIDFQFQSLFEKVTNELEIGQPYVHQIHNLEPNVAITPEEAYKRACMMIHEMSDEVFRSMSEMNGDFELFISSSLSALTYMQLNFFSDNEVVREPLIFPTYFSGLITQKWGTASHAALNNENYCKWMDAIQDDFAYRNKPSDWERSDLTSETFDLTTPSDNWYPEYNKPHLNWGLN